MQKNKSLVSKFWIWRSFKVRPPTWRILKIQICKRKSWPKFLQQAEAPRTFNFFFKWPPWSDRVVFWQQLVYFCLKAFSLNINLFIGAYPFLDTGNNFFKLNYFNDTKLFSLIWYFQIDRKLFPMTWTHFYWEGIIPLKENYFFGRK